MQICHFCFSIHKLNFNWRLCKMVVNIIIYIRIIFYAFVIISFYVICILTVNFIIKYTVMKIHGTFI
jgi:hypothetical protein